MSHHYCAKISGCLEEGSDFLLGGPPVGGQSVQSGNHCVVPCAHDADHDDTLLAGHGVVVGDDVPCGWELADEVQNFHKMAPYFGSI